jgi:hypothetical protein
MRNIGILFIGVILLLGGCKKEIKQSDVKTIQVSLTEGEIKTSELFSIIEPVILETTDSSLLKDISKSYLTKDYIFIKSLHALFIFDREGHFLRKIERIGNGPEEYARLSDFDVDEKTNNIYILDKARKKILVYDFEGEYLRTFSTDFWATKLIKTDLEQIYLYSGNEESPSNQYKLNLLTESSLKRSFLKIDDKKKEYLHINSAQNFYWMDGELFFFEAFNDTIYNLQKGMPCYFLNYTKPVPASFFERKFTNIMDFFQKYNQEGYTNSTYNAFENENKLFFSCFYRGMKYFNVYHKNKQLCNSYGSILDDMLFSGSVVPYAEDDFEFWTNRDSEIIYYVSSQYATENIENITDSHNRQLLEDIMEDNNPVAIICKLKD